MVENRPFEMPYSDSGVYQLPLTGVATYLAVGNGINTTPVRTWTQQGRTLTVNDTGRSGYNRLYGSITQYDGGFATEVAATARLELSHTAGAIGSKLVLTTETVNIDGSGGKAVYFATYTTGGNTSTVAIGSSEDMYGSFPLVWSPSVAALHSLSVTVTGMNGTVATSRARLLHVVSAGSNVVTVGANLIDRSLPAVYLIPDTAISTNGATHLGAYKDGVITLDRKATVLLPLATRMQKYATYALAADLVQKDTGTTTWGVVYGGGSNSIGSSAWSSVINSQQSNQTASLITHIFFSGDTGSTNSTKYYKAVVSNVRLRMIAPLVHRPLAVVQLPYFAGPSANKAGVPIVINANAYLGVTNGTVDSYVVDWRLDGVAVASSTTEFPYPSSISYTPTAADIGKSLTIRVTAIDMLGNSLPSTSLARVIQA